MDEKWNWDSYHSNNGGNEIGSESYPGYTYMCFLVEEENKEDSTDKSFHTQYSVTSCKLITWNSNRYN